MFDSNQKYIPLSERLRPRKLSEVIGQEHLLGENGPLRQIIENQRISSILFWGPPGVGKTTLSKIIAEELDLPHYQLSAIDAGVKEVRNIIEAAKRQGGAILFIDEIHRFNKSQQDALLGAVEKGVITLIGATTENPSFEVNSALLSRSQVYTLESLEKDDLLLLVNRVINEEEQIKKKKIQLEETDALINFSGGDARRLINILELIINSFGVNDIIINNKEVERIVQTKAAKFDKKGENHYDIASAMIKSIRGTDPNAAVYYLARMLEGGEDPKFIARRLIISAAEDIGNANPNALLLATTTFDAVSKIGMPESRIILSQCVTYLASSPKSNAAYMAINNAMSIVKQTGDLDIPLHLRNAPTSLMKDMNYGKNYKYSHDFPSNFIDQEYLPKELTGNKLYDPGNNPAENKSRAHLKALWKNKYDY